MRKQPSEKSIISALISGKAPRSEEKPSESPFPFRRGGKES